jgi:serine/threonine protein kinase
LTDFIAIFKWVRGELIGKGNFGRVYLALNATTGEMIAVKQVEIPRTASDKNDTRQMNVVDALKLESETLKDLDHPNVVQYLGFEETPTFLSMCACLTLTLAYLTHAAFQVSWNTFLEAQLVVVCASTADLMKMSPSLSRHRFLADWSISIQKGYFIASVISALPEVPPSDSFG